MDKIREISLNSVLKACSICLEAQKKLIKEEEISKDDKSPVTIADFAVQALIIHELCKVYDYPFIAEEDSNDLKNPKNEKLVERILELLKAYIPNWSKEDLFNTLDKGKTEKILSSRYWTLDPIDGTMGFLRREQYAVALALMEDHKPILGILGCPALKMKLDDPNSEVGCVLIGVKDQGAFQRSLNNPKEYPIFVSKTEDPKKSKFTESFVSRGIAQELNTNIAKSLGVQKPPLRIDSQCKYAVLARGDSDIYLRLSSFVYREKIWDHAAGILVVEQAGGIVKDMNGEIVKWGEGKEVWKEGRNIGFCVWNGKVKEVMEICKKEVEMIREKYK